MHKENEDFQKGIPEVWHLAFVRLNSFVTGSALSPVYASTLGFKVVSNLFREAV